MALRPKLEFFRFQLNHNDVRFKTFRDFAREVLYQRRINSDTQIMHKYLDHVRNSLVTKDAQDDSIKKQLKLISTAANIYAAYMPTVDPANHLIYGVINGGRFGRHGLMSDSDVTATDAKAFGKDKTILRYYYFLLYLPLDHNEGFLAIHSNSREETITDVMKTFVRRLFNGNGYISPKSTRSARVPYARNSKTNRSSKNWFSVTRCSTISSPPKGCALRSRPSTWR